MKNITTYVEYKIPYGCPQLYSEGQKNQWPAEKNMARPMKPEKASYLLPENSDEDNNKKISQFDN